MTDLILGVGGLTASLYIMAKVIRRMGRKWHGLALWLLAVGLGVSSISMMFLSPGVPEDVFLTHVGEWGIMLGVWAIILTSGMDDSYEP